MELTFWNILPYIYLGGIIASYFDYVSDSYQYPVVRPTISELGTFLFLALIWPIFSVITLIRFIRGK